MHNWLINILRSLVSILLLTVMLTVQAQPLDTYTVKDKSVPKSHQFDAVIQAINASTVSSRISAEVTEINYDVDDVVPKGAVLMRFRDEEFRARVAQAEAGLLTDRAQYREALARQREANSDAKRMENLYKRKQITQSALDKAIANKGAADAKVQATQAQIEARKAQLDEAKVQLSYTVIKAPYSGIVTQRLIEIGEMASPGQHLMSGVSLDKLRAVVMVPQYLRNSVKNADSVVVDLDDGRHLKGQEVTIAPEADAHTHTFRVRVNLPEDVKQLYPGSYAKVHFIGGTETVRLVPESAIVHRSEIDGVYVVEPNNIVFRQVRLGRHFPNGEREVLAGLEQGEKIATNPELAVRAMKLSQP